jgi:hypothetical protein
MNEPSTDSPVLGLLQGDMDFGPGSSRMLAMFALLRGRGGRVRGMCVLTLPNLMARKKALHYLREGKRSRPEDLATLADAARLGVDSTELCVVVSGGVHVGLKNVRWLEEPDEESKAALLRARPRTRKPSSDAMGRDLRTAAALSHNKEADNE